jgi:phytoene/squalene synthetase
MSDPVSRPSGRTEDTGERRSNEVLRALVTEMLERVRELHRHASAWTPAERAQAESELEAIMKRVRGEAGHTIESR